MYVFIACLLLFYLFIYLPGSLLLNIGYTVITTKTGFAFAQEKTLPKATNI